MKPRKSVVLIMTIKGFLKVHLEANMRIDMKIHFLGFNSSANSNMNKSRLPNNPNRNRNMNRAYMNTNICSDLFKYKYNYEYSSQSDMQIVQTYDMCIKK